MYLLLELLDFVYVEKGSYCCVLEFISHEYFDTLNSYCILRI